MMGQKAQIWAREQSRQLHEMARRLEFFAAQVEGQDMRVTTLEQRLNSAAFSISGSMRSRIVNAVLRYMRATNNTLEEVLIKRPSIRNIGAKGWAYLDALHKEMTNDNA